LTVLTSTRPHDGCDRLASLPSRPADLGRAPVLSWT
jgi:hypothetical protein